MYLTFKQFNVFINSDNHELLFLNLLVKNSPIRQFSQCQFTVVLAYSVITFMLHLHICIKTDINM